MQAFLLITGILLPGIIASLDFIYYLILGKRAAEPWLPRVLGIIVVGVYPLLYLFFFDFGQKNDCCRDSAAFSPVHRITIYFWIFLTHGAFFYMLFRKQVAPPLAEVLLNSILVLGIVCNAFIGYHVNVDNFFWIFNVFIILIFVIKLIENQRAFYEQLQNKAFKIGHPVSKIAFRILTLAPYYKYPVLILLCLPVLVICAAILMLFGQQPDAVVRAFTDTYKHGFSQWDYKCENVSCGGHYLCSVAANGHTNIVKPQRLGVRRNHYIVCNRQLLVSNAFEELITEKYPKLHRVIRRNYNKVGNVIHKYYSVFENKYISDVIYILMKPLEWFFISVLYLFDHHPENRIEKQYIRKSEVQHIESHF